MKARLARTLTSALVLGAAMLTPNYSNAQAWPTCARWDESDAMRCFDCMKLVSTPNGMRRVNTCPPRYFNGGWGPPTRPWW